MHPNKLVQRVSKAPNDVQPRRERSKPSQGAHSPTSRGRGMHDLVERRDETDCRALERARARNGRPNRAELAKTSRQKVVSYPLQEPSMLYYFSIRKRNPSNTP